MMLSNAVPRLIRKRQSASLGRNSRQMGMNLNLENKEPL